MDSPQSVGDEAEFVNDAIDDDEVTPEEHLLLDRKELHMPSRPQNSLRVARSHSPRRRLRSGTTIASNVPVLSRGTSISIGPISVITASSGNRVK
jgi:hypothetical protein